MSNIIKTDAAHPQSPEEVSDLDIFDAMKEMSGYIDITLEDFREIYLHAYMHAHKKVNAGKSSASVSKKQEPLSGREHSVISEKKRHTVKNYFIKMRGGEHSPPRIGVKEIVWSWIGAFSGIALVSYCNIRIAEKSDLMLFIASFGASAVLIYGAVKSPLAQPRNFIGGHIISAVIGVACYKYFFYNPWFASAMAVACAIAVMHVTRTLHPPGGATALIAVIGSNQIHALGYYYAIIPVGIGAFIMLAVALVVNNIPSSRRYPEYWF